MTAVATNTVASRGSVDGGCCGVPHGGDLSGVPAYGQTPPPILRKSAGRCACGGIAGPSGECAACRQRRLAAEGDSAVASSSAGLVSKPGDTVERDADRLAAAVLDHPAAPSPSLLAPILRSAHSDAPRPVPDNVLGAVHAAGPGRPLDPDIRATMEAGLGTSLAGIRVHTGSAAAASSRALDADAYTVGDHIVFGADAYAPRSPAGQRLLAHELAHVVQSRAATAPPAILRQACGHDGRAPECGAGGLGRWRLVDVATDAVMNWALDDLVVKKGLAPLFGGPDRWVTQVWTPPNPYKSGIDRGRVDGMKVTLGSALQLEVVEVKSRGTEFNGGCQLATREAQGYVTVLRRIASRVVAISQAKPPSAGLQIPTRSGRDRARLRAAGIDVSDPLTAQALAFYNSLQAHLGRPIGPLTSMTVTVNRDGTPDSSYPVLTVLVDCKTRGRAGVRTRELVFQVNKAGGVSYGCENSPCQDEDEAKRKRQVQQVPQTGTQPAAQPGAQGQPQGVQKQATGDEDKPGTPKHTPAHDPTLPVIVAVGAGGAIAIAKARARRIAAREAAELAAKQALQAAWRREAEEAAARRLAKAGAGKAAGKAVAYVEIAAAAALVIFYSDRAEAHVGPGESPIESLYKAMTASGHPPSKELRALIESDPVLKELAERGGSGDASALQEEATRRVMELVRDNPGEFSPDDLEMLAKFSQTSGLGGHGPQSAEQLRAAIEAARRGQKATGGKPGATGTGAGAGATAKDPGAAGRTATDPSAASKGGGAGSSATGESADLPQLTPAGRALLPQPGTPIRRVFDAMVGGTGTGLSVTDDAVRRYLATMPADLTAAEAATLSGQLRPLASETLDDVMKRLAESVKRLRASRQAAPAHAGAHESQTQKPAHPAKPGQKDGATTKSSPARKPAHGQRGAAPTPSAGHGRAPESSESPYVEAALKAIRGFGAWESLEINRFRFRAGGDRDWRVAAPGSRVLGWAYIRVPTAGGGDVHSAAVVRLEIVAHHGTSTTVRVVEAGALIHEDGSREDAFTPGETFELSAPQ